jgi:hypothetical protein
MSAADLWLLWPSLAALAWGVAWLIERRWL